MTTPRSDAPLTRRAAEILVRESVETGRLGRAGAERLAASLGHAAVRGAVLEGAFESKRRVKGDVITFSRNVFIPLTNLCRDRCSYCTFAKPDDSPEAKTYTLDEVAAVVRAARGMGCTEALFCLGDKPEKAYASYRRLLAARGFGSTAEFLVHACDVALAGGMLPHTNAGVLSRDEMAALRPVNASMGLMLETTSPRLRGKGMPHYYAPDKEPARRLRMHEEAGELRILFTTGMLIGIGERPDERVDTLLAIRDLQERFGHIQETIIQPFHPKPGTPMRAASARTNEEIAGWIGLARLVLGPDMNLQAPPNLAPDALEALARTGLNDWGGVSPITLDFINPEAPWPALDTLRQRTEATGQRLLERLPIYPEDVISRPHFLAARVRQRVQALRDSNGFARASAASTATFRQAPDAPGRPAQAPAETEIGLA
ncbi:MAG: 7,8-didemethyl-8-hydroxy-5-deazariboflavin synthase CofG [Deltaproteobacteria bacterium]|nr:MAG: 7,8-didemethyl-8-hydroxy-5-deazariboflavin synthase CofG [Deltaproteobacteria bacterium]